MFNEHREEIMQTVVDKVAEKFSDYYDTKLTNPSKRGLRDIDQQTDTSGADFGLANFKKHLKI